MAVDPSVIRYHTNLYIDGVGWRTALDAGSAIIGKTLDVWEPTVAECMQFGRRTLDVWAAA